MSMSAGINDNEAFVFLSGVVVFQYGCTGRFSTRLADHTLYDHRNLQSVWPPSLFPGSIGIIVFTETVNDGVVLGIVFPDLH